MGQPFFKYPHTPHLLWLSPGKPREDKVMSEEEAAAFLSRPVVVEEKVDGANVGLSVDSQGLVVAQNRGAVIGASAHPQFAPLWPWLATRQAAIARELGGHLMLFGEWCFAVHSVRYDALPDYFLAFDVYDRVQGRFLATLRRNEMCDRMGVKTVPLIAKGRFDRDGLIALLGRSKVGCGPAEGLYLRMEDTHRLLARAKLVRAEFVQSIEGHWMKRKMEKNHLVA